MKKIILTAALAAFALGATPAFADSLPVKVTKTKIPDGCEYKKVPGKAKKQLICIEDMQDGDGGGAVDGAAIDTTQQNVEYRGNSGNIVGANNGKGNGSADGVPGGSGKTKAANNDQQ